MVRLRSTLDRNDNAVAVAAWHGLQYHSACSMRVHSANGQEDQRSIHALSVGAQRRSASSAGSEQRSPFAPSCTAGTGATHIKQGSADGGEAGSVRDTIGLWQVRSPSIEAAFEMKVQGRGGNSTVNSAVKFAGKFI